MSLPRDGADALRECARILARWISPAERATMALNVEARVKSGDWTPVFRLPHVAALFYPKDDRRAAELLVIMERAREAGTFPSALPASEQAVTMSDLAAWIECPPVPADSPLRYWLPQSMHESPQDESDTTAISTEEPHEAGAAVEPAGVKVTTHRTPRRRDVLSPLIDEALREAQRKTGDANDGAAAWLTFVDMAKAGRGPLLGFVEDEVKYQNGRADDDVGFMTRKVFMQRVKRRTDRDR
jgi:hypothetical protein